jgi:prolyl oligopeptidase
MDGQGVAKMLKVIPILATFILTLISAPAPVVRAAALGDQAYEWLETPRDPAAIEWAATRTASTLKSLLADPEAPVVLKEVRDAAKLASLPPPFVQPYSVLGDTIARFVKDSEHPAGLVQTAPRGPKGIGGPWRTVLDVDALNAQERQAYGLPVLNLSTSCLPPEYRRCLIPLGIGGSEIQQVREFDLKAGIFLDQGFRFATAKTEVTWLDENTLLVAQAVPGGDTLKSGFPAKVRLWKRGTPYSEGRVVFTAGPNDAFFRLTAVGIGKERKGVISAARDVETHFDTFVVAMDGSVTSTHLPTAGEYPGNLGLSGGTTRYVVISAVDPVTVNGRRYPGGSVFAYDTGEATPPDQRISLVYAAPKGTYLDSSQFGFAFSGSHIYMVTRRNLARTLTVATPGASGWKLKTLLRLSPGDTISLWGGSLASDAVVLGQESYLKPPAISLIEGERCCVPLATNPAAFDAGQFLTEIRTAKSRDGTLVDYYLVRPRKPKPGLTPTILSAYGGGGGVIPPAYAARLLDGALVSWLTRGGAYAFAGIRGGGENGRAWYRAGTLRNKPNGLDDVAAVAQDLIRSGFTSPKKLGLTGRSYGGLMAAAVAVRSPDLFAAVLDAVPLTDLFPAKNSIGQLSTMKGALGDPDDPDDRAVMLSYSPLQNIRQGVHYPRILSVCSTSDDRVGPGPARRFTAKLEAMHQDPLLLEGPTGGHLFPKASTDPEAVTAEAMFFIETLMR